MDQDLIKKRQRELSKQQAIFVAARERGVPRRESAIMAGYKVDESGKGPAQVEKSKAVSTALALARQELAQKTGITKEEVLQGLKDAAEMARVMADPQAMVRAFSEIGKMLGFYEPEKKVVEHQVGKQTMEALRMLSDEELLKLAKGRVIEGEVLDKKEESDEPEEQDETVSEVSGREGSD